MTIAVIVPASKGLGPPALGRTPPEGG
jgi:hypothetical protein